MWPYYWLLYVGCYVVVTSFSICSWMKEGGGGGRLGRSERGREGREGRDGGGPGRNNLDGLSLGSPLCVGV